MSPLLESLLITLAIFVFAAGIVGGAFLATFYPQIGLPIVVGTLFGGVWALFYHVIKG